MRVLDVYNDEPARPPRGSPRSSLQYIHLYVLTSVALQDIIGIIKRQSIFYLMDLSALLDPPIMTLTIELMLRVVIVTLDFRMVTVWIPQTKCQQHQPSTAEMPLENYARVSSAFTLYCEFDSVDRLRGFPSSSFH